MQFESFHSLIHHRFGVCLLKFSFSLLYFGGVFNKLIIPLALVGYEIIIANSGGVTRLVGIYHLIYNARSWNNC